jgi:SET domain-containing protein
MDSGIIIIQPALITQPSEIHGRGLFAKDAIERFSLICEEVVKNLAKNSAVVFDGPLRWVNHSVKPNAMLLPNFDIQTSVLTLKLMALRNIEIGEEITYDYIGAGHKGLAAKCNCGQPDCPGFFHLRSEFAEDK